MYAERFMKNAEGSHRTKGMSETHFAAGARLLADHCAECHGSGALGRGKKPSLRSTRVQQATDGEIFWLLKNGYRREGMPSWNSLPEPVRWQIIAYIKSLGVGNAHTPCARKEQKR